MKVAIVLFGLLAYALAMPAPQELPAGISAAECPNYPYCGVGPDQVRLKKIDFQPVKPMHCFLHGR